MSEIIASNTGNLALKTSAEKGRYLFAQQVKNWVQTWESTGGPECIIARVYFAYNDESHTDSQLFDKAESIKAISEFCRECGLSFSIEEGMKIQGRAPEIYCSIKCSDIEVTKWFTHFEQKGERLGFLKFIYDIEKCKVQCEIGKVLPKRSSVASDARPALCVSGFYREDSHAYLWNSEGAEGIIPGKLAREIRPPFEFRAGHAEIRSRREVMQAVADFEHEFPEDWPTDSPPGIEEAERDFAAAPRRKPEDTHKILGIFLEMDISAGTECPRGFRGKEGDNYAFSVIEFSKLHSESERVPIPAAEKVKLGRESAGPRRLP